MKTIGMDRFEKRLFAAIILWFLLLIPATFDRRFLIALSVYTMIGCAVTWWSVWGTEVPPAPNGNRDR
tara:strand:+ start:298 stop:501 length:204 start_codon:yes stop_codon:yes gene_type:complete